MKLVYFVILFIFLIIFNVIFIVFAFYDNEEKNEVYVHTKAICEGNVCRDYKITCKGEEILESVPLTGFIVFNENWKDVRLEKNPC